MNKVLTLVLIACVLTACSYDSSEAARRSEHTSRAMPDIYQSVTPSQQRAIMSGERPDWTEVQPVRIPQR